MIAAISFAALGILGVSASSMAAQDGRISLSLAKRINVTTPQQIVKGDRARVQHLLKGAAPKTNSLLSKAVVDVGVTTQGTIYTASIGVGSPPTTYNVIVDTGSANTWVGAGTAYVPTNTSVWTGNLVEVIYGSGSFIGNEFMDTVSISPSLTIPGQLIGAAVDSEGFNGLDGILGIGPARLTNGTLLPNTTSIVPTVTDNLFGQGMIAGNLVSVSFEPTTELGVQNGELTFGGIDSSKFTGNITYTPVTTVSPASNYWGINQNVMYGSQKLLSGASGFVDTGTTVFLLATDAFSAYQNATGGVFDDVTGLLSITSDQFANLKSLFFEIGGTTFELTPNAQIWPRALNSAIGGAADAIYLMVADIGQPSGNGLDFVNGLGFLERFYSVYDTQNSRVGLAMTPFTNATTN